MQIVTEPFGPIAQFGAGSIYIPCSFDSHAESCLVDTGSDTTNIQDDNFSETYPVVGHTTGEGLSGNPTPCDIIEIAQFVLGDNPLGQHQIVRCAAPASNSGGASQGNLAGLSSFSGHAMQFDFISKTFSMNNPIPVGWAPQPLIIHPQLGHFGFQILVDGIRVDSIVDTGAAITTIDKDFIQAHPDAFLFVEAVSGGVDSNGNPITLNLYQVKSLTFANVTLTDTYAFGADFSFIEKFIPNVPVIFGFNAISQRNWYFDLAHKVWATNR